MEAVDFGWWGGVMSAFLTRKTWLRGGGYEVWKRDAALTGKPRSLGRFQSVEEAQRVIDAHNAPPPTQAQLRHDTDVIATTMVHGVDPADRDIFAAAWDRFTAPDKDVRRAQLKQNLSTLAEALLRGFNTPLDQDKFKGALERFTASLSYRQLALMDKLNPDLSALKDIFDDVCPGWDSDKPPGWADKKKEDQP